MHCYFMEYCTLAEYANLKQQPGDCNVKQTVIYPNLLLHIRN